MKLPLKFILIWNFILEYSSDSIFTEPRPVLRAEPDRIILRRSPMSEALLQSAGETIIVQGGIPGITGEPVRIITARKQEAGRPC